MTQVSKAWSVGNKQTDSASFLDFGAVGDGVFDNHAAMVLAIASGKSFQVPDGVFLIDLAPFGANRRTGFTPADGITISGPGTLKTVFESAGTAHLTPDLFYCRDVKNVKFIGVNFDNVTDHDITGSTTQGVQSFIGMESTVDFGVDDVLIQGCTFKSSFSSCINVWEKLNDTVNSLISRHIRVLGCHFENTGGHAVGIVKGERCVVSDNTGYDIGNIIFAGGAAPGLMVDFSNGCSWCVADSNVVQFCRAGYKCQDFGTVALGEGSTHHITFTNNTATNIKDVATGYLLQLSGFDCVADGNLLDVGIDEVTGLPSTEVDTIKGVFIQDNARRCLVSDNIVLTNTGDGIRVGGDSATANQLRGNKIVGNHITSGVTGIRIKNDKSAQVDNNTIIATGIGIAWESTYLRAHGNHITAPSNCIKISDLGDNTGLVAVDLQSNVLIDGNMDLSFAMGTISISHNDFQLSFVGPCILIGAQCNTEQARAIIGNTAVLDAQAGAGDVFLVTTSTNVLRNAVVTGNSIVNNRTVGNARCLSAAFLGCTINNNFLGTTGSQGINFKTGSDFNMIGPNIYRTNGGGDLAGSVGAGSITIAGPVIP